MYWSLWTFGNVRYIASARHWGASIKVARWVYFLFFVNTWEVLITTTILYIKEVVSTQFLHFFLYSVKLCNKIKLRFYRKFLPNKSFVIASTEILAAAWKIGCTVQEGSATKWVIYFPSYIIVPCGIDYIYDGIVKFDCH